jgi:flagellar hook-associated protein 1 FlgK
MGLSTALNSAVSGLQVTQAGVEIVSRNVANADTPGYTRKLSQQLAVVVNGEAIGARSAETTRVLDSLLQLQLRASTSAKARTDVLASVLSRLDALFGIPGGAGALDTAVNDFAASLQGLVDSPESQTARAGVVAQAEALAVRLNALSDGIQDLRADAERSLAEAAASANQILGRLAEINGLIVASTGSDVDLLDQRDQLLKDLSVLLDIQVQEADTGSLRVFTAAGNLLLDGRTAKTLVFDPKSQLSAQNLYDTDPAKRQVGTLLLDNGAGQLLDLFASGDIRSGLIGGYRELRDDLLVDAQAQLDELAHALASALSERQISGGAVSLGAQDGFDVDLAALLPGDEVSITYTQTPPGQTHTVTVVRVEDASLLPLDNALTADPGDTVIGIDFSAGIGAAAAALGATLGGSFSVSNPSGDTLRVLDDGAAGTIDISQLTARVTATGTADQGLGLALFTDGPGGAVYTNALDGGAQRIGFAGRIAVNPAVRADSSTLVVYSTSPPTPPGDQSRPLELLTRLTETPVGFIPTGGLGSASSPLVTSIDGYARELIVLQTGRAAAAEAESNAQTAVTATIEQRFSDESGVDVDQELARLIVLQSAYSANARVISVIQELLDLLVRV